MESYNMSSLVSVRVMSVSVIHVIGDGSVVGSCMLVLVSDASKLAVINTQHSIVVLE